MRVAEIGGDPESDHYARDGLLLDVLKAIAAGATDPAALAVEALRVQDLELELWYA
jgi:hypothetical protein